ncbi:MAG: serine hydrolase domain-containing protein [Chitinophagaceae bacterium]
MKTIFYTVFFLICAPGLYSQSAVQKIDALLQTYYKEDQPGAFVQVSRHNQPVFRKGYGLASMQTKEKISSSTAFNIGSITKQFTAFCIVQLAEKKQLSLQDKLVKYFPGFNAAVGNAISIQQLLTHSSGIIDHYAFTDTTQVKHATDKDVLQAIEHIDSTYFTPGTAYRYSNTAYCLLALIIEKVTGMPYPAYIKKNIFLPLSLQHAAVLQVGKPIDNQAYGYDYDSSKNHFQRLDAADAIFFSTEGDGGIYLSADEYLKWFQSLQKPLAANKKLVQQCRDPQFVIDAGKKLAYGYGWFVSQKDSVKAVYHSGSNGGFRAMVFTLPEKDYIVTIFSNRTGVDLEDLVQQINDLLRVTNNSFTKIEALVSFIHTSPIFAQCKEIL